VAEFGARNWLRLSGAKVRVTGHELLTHQSYVFISNHRSYLDTERYYYTEENRLLAKKELLKVPILGYEWVFVNVMAIDRRS